MSKTTQQALPKLGFEIATIKHAGKTNDPGTSLLLHITKPRPRDLLSRTNINVRWEDVTANSTSPAERQDTERRAHATGCRKNRSFDIVETICPIVRRQSMRALEQRAILPHDMARALVAWAGGPMFEALTVHKVAAQRAAQDVSAGSLQRGGQRTHGYRRIVEPARSGRNTAAIMVTRAAVVAGIGG